MALHLTFLDLLGATARSRRRGRRRAAADPERGRRAHRGGRARARNGCPAAPSRRRLSGALSRSGCSRCSSSPGRREARRRRRQAHRRDGHLDRTLPAPPVPRHSTAARRRPGGVRDAPRPSSSGCAARRRARRPTVAIAHCLPQCKRRCRWQLAIALGAFAALQRAGHERVRPATAPTRRGPHRVRHRAPRVPAPAARSHRLGLVLRAPRERRSTPPAKARGSGRCAPARPRRGDDAALAVQTYLTNGLGLRHVRLPS